MTYTIVARCPRTRRLGIGIATYSLGVGGYCPFVVPHRAAISSQAFADPSLGWMARNLAAIGHRPARVLTELAANDPHFNYRQVGIVDIDGRAECHTGANTRPWSGHVCDAGMAAFGNVLAGSHVVAAIAQAFRDSASAELDERLLRALEAGRDAAGQQAADGTHLTERSASLLVYADEEWPELDLRVDSHDAAVDELRRVHGAYTPYLPYYRLRAVDPPNTPAQDVWARENLGGS